MAITDWNWRHPTELQDMPWDCAAASTAWALQACGHPYTEAEVVKGLGRHRISAAWGLLDSSGAGIVEWLAEIGIGAANASPSSWDDVIGAAGHQPMLMGGLTWCHWTGVRVSTLFYPELEPAALALANPAPGWGGIEQTMQVDAFERLGPFSAVWLTSW
jgi:hypothetical protein